MPWPLLDILFSLPLYALVLFRVSGLALTAPLLASGVIPVRIRAAFVMTVSAMIFPVVAATMPRDLTLSQAVLGGATELMIGATIGLGLRIALMSAEVAGMMVAQQAGLALGQVFDPMQNRQTTVISQVFTIVLTLVFLAIGGHRAMIAALLDTFEALPLLSASLERPIVLLLAEALTASFILAIRMAGPVLIALFMLATALNFLSRTMPQFNILTVGFTLRVIVGIGVAGLAISESRDLMIQTVWDGLALVRGAFGLDPSAVHLTDAG